MIHARADKDEAAYHIHAVIACWKRVKITSTKHSGADRWMLQPSSNPLIEDYEKAQDSVGKAFASIGLRRGERRKQAFREVIANGEEPAPRLMHVRPVDYLRKEDIRQAAEKKRLEAEAARVAERETSAEAKEAEAEAIIAGAEGIGDGSLEFVEHEAAPELRPAKASKGTDAEDHATRSLLARLGGSARGRSRIAVAMSAALGQAPGAGRGRSGGEGAHRARARTCRDGDRPGGLRRVRGTHPWKHSQAGCAGQPHAGGKVHDAAKIAGITRNWIRGEPDRRTRA